MTSRVIRIAKHYSDELDAVTVDHDGLVLVEPTEDGNCVVHFRLGGDARSYEALIASFRKAEESVWDLVRVDKLTPLEERLSPETTCRVCQESLSRHVSRGTRFLECPNRCPGCDDQGIFSALVDEHGTDVGIAVRAVWVMDFGKSEPPTEIDFCPFCGLDFRGSWLLGVPPSVK